MHPARSLLFLVSVLALATPSLTAPQAAPSAPGTQAHPRSEPKGTIDYFLRAMDNKAENWREQALSCLDAPAAMQDSERWQASVLLLGVLNRLPIATLSKLPARNGVATLYRGPDGAAGAARGALSFLLPPMQRQPEGTIELTLDAKGLWLFSAETISGIRSLYEAVEALAPVREGRASEEDLDSSLWLRRLMPEGLRKEALSLEYWQWLGIFLIVLLGIVLDFTVRTVLRHLAQRTLGRLHTVVSRDTTTAAVRPIGLCSAAFLWVALLPLIGLAGVALTVLKGAVALFAVLAGTWAAWRIVDLVAEAASYKASKTETRVDDILIPLVRKSVKIFILIFGVIYAAESMSVEIAPLIASLGIGGLAFAFAAKDTIENFFGSIAVLVDRPFQVGDWIVVGDVEGIVEDLGFRSTRVRTFYNSLVTLPNSTLVRATVDNYGKRKYRRTKCHIGVQYDTSPEKVLAFREGIMELVRTHPYTRKDYYQVWFHQFGPSSLDILLYVFFEVPDWSTELRERERLFLDIMRLAERLGVEFAFPTRTVHLVRSGEEEEDTAPSPRSMTELRARVTGIRASQDLTMHQPWQSERPGPVVYSEGPTPLEGLDEEEIPGEERRET